MAKKPRIIIPENPTELLQLGSRVLAQHQTLRDKSPLRLLETPNWDDHGQDVVEGLRLQDEISQLERRLRDLYGQREPLTQNVASMCRKSRDLLLGVYASNPARLGEFGFDVVEAAAPRPASAAKAPKG